MDFVNKMLPNLTKTEKSDEKIKVDGSSKKKPIVKRSVKNNSTPVVNMTRTAQLRMSKIQKLKSEANNNKDENKFKVPLAPLPLKSKNSKNATFKRI